MSFIQGPCSKQECYCPSVGSCENYVYRISLNKLFTTHPDKCQYNRKFFFTIVVTSNARLINIKHLDILVGDFPPDEGASKEKKAGRSDTDCTSENKIIVIQTAFIFLAAFTSIHKRCIFETVLGTWNLGILLKRFSLDAP